MPIYSNNSNLSRFSQGFETDTGGFALNGGGSIAVVASGAGGVSSFEGDSHAVVEGPGAFTRFDGYRSSFSGGYSTAVTVYLDPNWALGEGFDWSVAANGQDGVHQRDFIFHVARDASTGDLLVGASNGSTHTPSENIEAGAHAVVAEAGWYTFQHEFRANEDGELEVVMTLFDAAGAAVFTHTLNDNSDLIASEVGGNRYGWFVANNVTGGLAVDSVEMSTADTNPFIVKDGNNIIGSYATQEDAIAAIESGDISGAALAILESGSAEPAIFYVAEGMSIQAAINAAAAGDIVMLGAGTFAGDVALNKDVTIVGAEGGESVVAGVINVTAHGASIDGLTITGGSLFGQGMGVHVAANDVTISNSVLEGPGTGNTAGITTSYGSTVTGLVLSDNTVEGWRYGVYLNPSVQVTATGNTFDANQYAGLAVDGPLAGSSITGNTFTETSGGLGLGATTETFDAGALASDNTFPAGDGPVIGIYAYGQLMGGSFTTQTIEGTDEADYISGEWSSVVTDQVMRGNDGDDVIEAFGGADTLDGGAGADTLDGGAGNDLLIVDAEDTVDGGSGTDTAIVADMATASALDATSVEIMTDGEGTFFVLEGMSIQAAIDAASAGDTIVVAAGDYSENLSLTKGLNFLTSGGEVNLASATPNTSVITLSGDHAGGDTLFNGFNISGATGNAYSTGSGVYVTAQNIGILSFTDVTVSGNASGGITSINGDIGHFVVQDSDFANNASGGVNSGAHLKMFGFTGSAVLANLVIDGAAEGTPQTSRPDYGIEFHGIENATLNGNPGLLPPMGAISIENVTVTGEFHKTAFAINNYADVEGLSIEGLDLSGATAFWGMGNTASFLFNVDGISSDFNIGDYQVTFNDGWPSLSLRGEHASQAAVDSTLTGSDGSDLIFGNGGADTIDGGQGADIVNGGAGDDVIVFDAADSIDGGLGIDTVTVADAAEAAAFAAGGATGVELVRDADGVFYVSEGMSIQDAIDAAPEGATIMIAAGVYNENLVITTNGLNLVAAEGAVLQGSFMDDNGIDGSLVDYLNTHESYDGQLAGTGMSVSGDNVTISGLAVQGYLWAVELADGVDGLTLTDVAISESVMGIHKEGASDATDLAVNGGSFTDVYLGMNIVKDPAEGVGNLNGFTMNGTSFDHLGEKGMYFETLLNALITNITMNDVGAFGRALPFTPTAGGESGTGLELNLKYDQYSNIVIDGFEFTNVGQSTGASGVSHFGAAGIQIKVRDQGSYQGNPATFVGSVTISNGSIDGTSVGIRQGEANGNVAGPQLIITDVTIVNALRAALENVTQSPMSVNGTAGDDTLSLSLTSGSTGAVTVSGGEGYDTLHLGAATGDVTVDFIAGTVTANGKTIAIDSIENVTVGEAADLVVALDANNLPDDVVELEGSDGFDTLEITVANATAGDIVRMVSGGDSIDLDVDGDGVTDLTVSGVEEIVLNGQHIVLQGDFSDTGLSNDTVIMNGTAGNDVLDGRLMTSDETIEAYGLGGNDLIYGAGGNDLLDGGTGSDNIYGGDGDDTFVGSVDGVGDSYRGEGGNDTVDYSAGTGAMNINLNNAASGGGVGTDQLFNIENAIGSAFADNISGSTGDNRITGGAGNDTINGNGGVDTVVINANATSGIGVQSPTLFRIAVTTADGTDTLRNVEFIQFNNALIQVDGATGNAYAYGADDAAAASEGGGASAGNVLTNDLEIEAADTISVSGVRTGIESAGGAMTTVSGATVIVGAHGTLTINPNGTYSYEVTDETLGAGDTATETFTYRVVDNAGQGSDAALIFTVSGANDGPVITGSTNGAIVEDGTASTSGSIGFSDIDLDDVHSASFEPNGMDYLGTFSIDVADDGQGDGAGSVSWSFEVDNAVLQSLSEGEVLTQSYTVAISDGAEGTASQVVTVTITGVNDAPVAAAADQDITENQTLEGSVGATDADDGDTVEFELVGDAPEGLEFDLETGNYTFDPATNFDHLAEGQTATVSFQYQVTDSEGAVSNVETVTITITGTNDGPVATTFEASVTEDVPFSGQLGATDADDGAVLTYALVGEDPRVSIASDGSYTIDTAAFQALADGETTAFDFTYSVTDAEGASDERTVTVTVTGVNDAPVTVDVDQSITENQVLEGSVAATDADGGDTVEFELVGDAPNGLTFDGETGAYTFDPFSNFDHLAQGDTETVSFQYIAIDSEGAESEVRTVTITVTGTNDAPWASTSGLGLTEDNAATGWLSASDIDDGAVLTYALVGDNDYVTVEADGAYTVDTSAEDFQSLAEGEQTTFDFTYSVTDEFGASDEQVVTVTVTGVNDGPAIVSPIVVSGSATEGSNLPAEPLTAETTPVVEEGEGANDGILTAQTIDRSLLAVAPNGEIDDAGVPSLAITGGTSTTADNDYYAIELVAGEVIRLDVDHAAAGVSPTEHDLVLFLYDSEGNPLEIADDHSVADAGSAARPTGSDTVDPHLVFTVPSTGTYYVRLVDYVSAGLESGQSNVPGPYTLNVSIDSSNVAVPDYESTGSFTFDDVDLTDEHSVEVTGDEDYVGTLTADITDGADGSGTGTVEWTWTASPGALEFLGEGEVVVQTYTVTISDGEGGTIEQQVAITLTGENDGPTVTSETTLVEVSENDLITGTIDFADVDLIDVHDVSVIPGDNDYIGEFNYELVDSTGDGAGQIAWSLDIDPATRDALADGEILIQSYTVTIDDGQGGTVEHVVNVTITGTNDGPTISVSNGSVNEDQTTSGSVAGDDVDGTIASYELMSATPAGLDFNTATGEYTFDASSYDYVSAGDSVPVSFDVRAIDNNGVASETRTVTITVNGVNDLPVAEDVSDTVDEDSEISGSVAALDEEDGTGLTYELVGETSPMGLTFNGDGTWSFDASEYDSLSIGETEVISVEYIAIDPDGGESEPRTLTITIEGSNDDPSVADDSFNVTEGGTVSGTFSGLDAEGPIASWEVVGAPPAGLEFDPETGEFTFDASSYEMEAGDSETVTFQVRGTDEDGALSDPATITIVIGGVNDLPVATDQTVEVDEDSEISGQVQATDDDSSAITFALVDPENIPAGLVFNTDGTYTFDAASYDELAENELGFVEVQYVAMDDEGGVSEPRTLRFEILGSNDQPEVFEPDFSVNEGDVFEGQVSGEDIDGEVVSYELTGTEPAGLIFNPDGSYTFDASGYELAQGASQTVTFQFRGTDDSEGVSDVRTVTITINGVNDNPIGSDDAASVSEDGSVSGALEALDDDGTVVSWDLVDEAPAGLTWDPETGAWSYDASGLHEGLDTGEDATISVDYTVTDNNGGVSEVRTLTITVNGANDEPVGSSAEIDVTEGETATGSVASTDIDGEDATYSVVEGSPEWLTFNSDGTYEIDGEMFELAGGATGTYSFDYVAFDGTEYSEPRTVTVNVTGVNDAPTVDDVSGGTVAEDGSASGSFAGADLDGSSLTYEVVGEAPEGFVNNGDGTWSFDASSYDELADGDELELSVTYTVTDADDATSETATISFVVTGSNDAPTISVMDGSVDEDATVTGSVVGDDVDDGIVAYEIVGATPDGLSFNTETGEYSFDASDYDSLNADEEDTVSFDVRARDEFGDWSETETITITINGVNDRPIAENATDEVDEDGEITGQLMADDEDGSVASYQLTGDIPTGLSLDPETGVYSFDAASYDYLTEGEELTVSATYTVTDDQGQLSDERTISILITGSNDGPVAAPDSTETVTEGDTLTGQLQAEDVDSEELTYTLTSGLPTGLSFDSDGSYSFDTSSYSGLNIGQSTTVSFTYIVTDDEDAESEERTVTITVQGAANRVTMDDGGDSFTGSNLDEEVEGGDSDDYINAGGGRNTVHGDEGDDTILTGAGADTITGDAGDDTVTAGSGNDWIDGGAGNDFINAGSGDDTVINSAGDDDLRGGTGIDTVSFLGATAGANVNLSIGGFYQTGSGVDQVFGFENAIGTAYADTLTGDDQANILEGRDGNDTLNGGLGADTMIGGLGNDSFYVDSVSDTVVELAGQGTDRVITTLSTYTLSANIENVYGSGTAGQTFIGNDGANTLFGSSGNDVLQGGLGGDTLIGGAGADVMYGGTGAANTMQGGLGDDTYYVEANDSYIENAGEGTDLAYVSLNTHTLRANVENMTFAGTGNFTGTGNALNNVITGGTGNDVLMGGAGNDTLNGGSGTDVARLSGLLAGYSITQEGSGWRVVDTNLADGNDGSDFLSSIETLMFSNGSTHTLPAMETMVMMSSKDAGPQVMPVADDFGPTVDQPLVLPGLMDDGFLLKAMGDEPLVLPMLSDDFKSIDGGPLVLPAELDFGLKGDGVPAGLTTLHDDAGLTQGSFKDADGWWSL